MKSGVLLCNQLEQMQVIRRGSKTVESAASWLAISVRLVPDILLPAYEGSGPRNATCILGEQKLHFSLTKDDIRHHS